MSDEEIIDVDLVLGKECADKWRKKTKKDLMNDVMVLVLKTRVQTETIDSLEDIERNLINQLEEGIALRKKRVSELETKLDKAEAYVEQGRAMINAVMERWYEYDA